MKKPDGQPHRVGEDDPSTPTGKKTTTSTPTSKEMNAMPITPTRIRANDDLHAQLDRLHVWIEQVPDQHRSHVSARLDQLRTAPR